MNKYILTTTMAALFAGLPSLRADDASSVTKSTVITNKDGTVTLTVDVNGKKETKTFKLGEGGGGVVAEAGDGKGGVKFFGTGKKVKATWLGVAVTPLGAEVRAQLPLQGGEGIVVSHVAPESPAAKAGLEQHDVLSRLDDQVLVSAEQFQTLVKMRKPGDKAKLVYYRKGERKDVEVALVEHEVEERPAGDILWKLNEGEAGLPNWEHLPDNVRERLEQFKAQGGNIRERLKDMKEKFPGVIVEKKAFIVGPDGKVKALGEGLEAMKDAMEKVRKQLEDAKVPRETIDEVHKALEAALDGVGDATKKAKDSLRNLRGKLEDEKPGDLLEKKDSAPAKP